MKNKILFQLLTAVVLVVMCLSTFTLTAFAYGDDPDGGGEVVETAPPTEPVPDNVLTPEGNMTLVDDVHGESAADKQFITVKSKNGNYFYIIIDRAASGENTVHFLNQVDEADLLALIDEKTVETKPIVCSCTEKCTPGAVNTSCQLCMTSMEKCVGKEKLAVQQEEPDRQSNMGTILALVLILALGGGAAYYFVVMKPKQAQSVPSDLDDFDLEDEEEYLNDDEEKENTI